MYIYRKQNTNFKNLFLHSSNSDMNNFTFFFMFKHDILNISRAIFGWDCEKNWTLRVYRSVTSSVIYKRRFDTTLFMNRWIPTHGRIILRILTGWTLMKSAFSAVKSKRKCVSMEFYRAWFSHIMKIAIDHYVNLVWICVCVDSSV